MEDSDTPASAATARCVTAATPPRPTMRTVAAMIAVRTSSREALRLGGGTAADAEELADTERWEACRGGTRQCNPGGGAVYALCVQSVKAMFLPIEPLAACGSPAP